MRTLHDFLFISIFMVVVLATAQLGQSADFIDCASSQAYLPEIECQALVDLYDSTNGDEWTNNNLWKIAEDSCSWYGVTCQGHVVFLDLRSNNLIGALPATLGNLRYLRSLTLIYNQLYGSIPSELSNTNLIYLNLGFNQLSGLIPPEFGYLANLSSLYLFTNRLIGPIPPEFGYLTNLTALNLMNNKLTGNIPVELGDLTNLRGLTLSGNNLTGTIPSEIGNLINLQGLALSSNLFSGTIPKELGNLKELTTLDLSGNQLTGLLPDELGELTMLRYFMLHSNQLTGTVPLSVAMIGAAVEDYCIFTNNSPSLCIPATSAYKNIAKDPICGLPLDPTCKDPSKKKMFPIRSKDGKTFIIIM